MKYRMVVKLAATGGIRPPAPEKHAAVPPAGLMAETGPGRQLPRPPPEGSIAPSRALHRQA